MTIYGWLQIIFYLVVLILLVKPLGGFMANVYQGERTFLSPVITPWRNGSIAFAASIRLMKWTGKHMRLPC